MPPMPVRRATGIVFDMAQIRSNGCNMLIGHGVVLAWPCWSCIFRWLSGAILTAMTIDPNFLRGLPPFAALRSEAEISRVSDGGQHSRLAARTIGIPESGPSPAGHLWACRPRAADVSDGSVESGHRPPPTGSGPAGTAPVTALSYIRNLRNLPFFWLGTFL
jgi:hypothetical protein